MRRHNNNKHTRPNQIISADEIICVRLYVYNMDCGLDSVQRRIESNRVESSDNNVMCRANVYSTGGHECQVRVERKHFCHSMRRAARQMNAIEWMAFWYVAGENERRMPL